MPFIHRLFDARINSTTEYFLGRCAELDAASSQNVAESELPSIAFHYTKIGSAVELVKSGEFWLTYFRSLNDKTEFTFGERLFSSMLEDREEFDPTQRRRALLPILKEAMSAFHCPNLYMFSLSADGDLKSQWWEYADGCRGVSVGFDIGNMSLAIYERRLVAVGEEGPLAAQILMAPVRYVEKEQRALITNCLDIWLPIISEAFDNKLLFGMNRIHIIAGFSGAVYRTLAFIKNPKCFEEKEIRILATVISTKLSKQIGRPAYRKPFEKNGRDTLILKYLMRDWRTIAAPGPLMPNLLALNPFVDRINPRKIVLGSKICTNDEVTIRQIIDKIAGKQVEFVASEIPY